MVKNLSFPDKGQVLIFDESLKGFGIRLNQGSKVFFAERRLEGVGRTRRITIGPYPIFKVADARKEAERIIGELARGYDRKAIEREQAAKTLSLGSVFDEYMRDRQLKSKTYGQYKQYFETYFKDWSKKAWIDIGSGDVKARHVRITKEHGPAEANLAFRILRAVLNYAIGVYRAPDDQPLLLENPIRVLSRTKSWNKIKPRENYIKPHHLAQWWQAVDSLKNKAAADFLKLIALTGLRRGEALALRWSSIDFAGRMLTVENTKNGDKHTLPLPPYLFDLLKARKAETKSIFVFPGEGKQGHVVEIKRAISQVAKQSGVKFSSHDLRRTFAVYATTLEISAYSLKRLLNHRSGGDVTYTHYQPLDIERLREPMRKINEYILSTAGVIPSAEIIPLIKETAS